MPPDAGPVDARPRSHVTVRVVYVFQRVLDGCQRVLGELDDIECPSLEQLVERVDRLFDPLHVTPHLAVGDELVERERLVDQHSQRVHVSRRALPRARRHQQQSPCESFILVRMVDQQLCERLRRQVLQVAARVIERWPQRAVLLEPAQSGRHAVHAELSLRADWAGAGEPQLTVLAPQLHRIVLAAVNRRVDPSSRHAQRANPAIVEVGLASFKRARRGQALHIRFAEHARELLWHRQPSLRVSSEVPHVGDHRASGFLDPADGFVT
jgi:hypothetical protein